MPVVKVIEVMAESEKGWEDATQIAVTEASKTVNNIESVWVKEMKALVDNGEVTTYRVNTKISFVVK
ncbi:dodecin domain-containing protein [candidate division GN15 bacterium]|nr:dodecin domain-containing protein [candidate division GN15 bacterium]